MRIHDHFNLSVSQQAILVYLRSSGGSCTAGEAVRRTRGVYGYLNDLRFMMYVDWNDPLTSDTEVRLTELGRDFLTWRYPTAPDDSDQTAQLVAPLFRGRDLAYEKDFVFVLMPFAEKFRLIYEDHIKPSLESRGYCVRRADDFYSTGPVMDDIWSAINKAFIVVADLTGRNTNVFYEVGICHTLGKEVILLSQTMKDVPFDLRHHRVIIYEHTPRGVKKLKDALRRTVDEKRSQME